MTSNKIIIAIVALVAFCVVSLAVVKHLANKEQVVNPVIAVSTESTLAPVVTIPTSVEGTTVFTTESTMPAPTEIITAATSDVSLTDPNGNTLTTYPISTNIATTLATTAATTVPTTVTTTKPVTTTKKTTDKYISEAAKKNSGFLGYQYNPTGDYYYTTNDPWQRYFGFNSAYDIGAQFVFMYYDTCRIKFPYGDKDWMVQFWKGQYGGVFVGCEIGTYYKEKSRNVEHYDCVSDADALFMELSFYKKGELQLTRDYAKYWWCTGFVPGKLLKYSDRSELSVKCRITMKDRTFLNAFLSGMENCKEFKFIEGVNYVVDGLDVFITY